MEFNLNVSRKPETDLNGQLIHEAIQIYGIKCLWLDSERVNEDTLVFQDFSHFKVDKESGFETVFLKPETTEMWEGDSAFGSFGLFQAQTAVLFISAIDLLRLYPDFLTDKGGRGKIVNSLIITPGSNILEITHMEAYHEGVANMWGYADNPKSYKLTVKLYAPNLSDENIQNVKDNVTLDEGEDGEIFHYDEDVDTSHIDDFFNDLLEEKKTIDVEGRKKSRSGGPFGDLS